MGKPVSSNAQRAETTALNTKVNKEILDKFRDLLKEKGYPMNVMLETFMQQYTNGRYELDKNNVVKWQDDNSDMDSLSTTFNKEIYVNFKAACRSNGYYMRYVITAFMEDFTSKNLILEYVDTNKKGD